MTALLDAWGSQVRRAMQPHMMRSDQFPVAPAMLADIALLMVFLTLLCIFRTVCYDLRFPELYQVCTFRLQCQTSRPISAASLNTQAGHV